MTNKKLSSIEWLLQEALQWNVDIRDNSQFIKFPSGAIEQAKEMHKQEIVDAYNQSWHFRDKPYETAEKYYNETYKETNLGKE